MHAKQLLYLGVRQICLCEAISWHSLMIIVSSMCGFVGSLKMDGSHTILCLIWMPWAWYGTDWVTRAHWQCTLCSVISFGYNIFFWSNFVMGNERKSWGRCLKIGFSELLFKFKLKIKDWSGCWSEFMKYFQ